MCVCSFFVIYVLYFYVRWVSISVERLGVCVPSMCCVLMLGVLALV